MESHSKSLNSNGHDAASIGSIIKYHRKKSGLTQQGLANLAGAGLTPIKQAEAGKKTIQLDTLLKIFAVLNIQILLHSKMMKSYESEPNEKS